MEIKYQLVKEKKAKPSREERGYTKARGRKDDWRQFFIHDDASADAWEKDKKGKK